MIDPVPSLTCYLHPGWAPRLRPAGPRRDWMEASPERFAYRCLPLAIANAHGWEIGSPCGFSARWHGGGGTEAVEIVVDEGALPHRRPVSLFGQGTITFHVEGLLRTSPGWNLWVGGPPNAAKDALAPLAGVIETDWSPYSFTMNWRFTRPGQWVRFEEDEAFCFFFPVPRGLDRVTPDTRPLEEAPELMSAFKRWSASREAFQAEVARHPPSAPADKWQKLYYRGVDPDGEEATADHQAKMRPQPFRDPSGAELCPVAHAKPKPKTEAAAPGSPAPAEPARPDRALLRRDWILETMERQRALSPMASQILHVRDLPGDVFLDEFYAASRPVLIQGMLADWPALARWTPDYLKRTVGDATITYQGGRTGSGQFELDKDRHRRELPFDAFIDLVTGAAGNDAYLTAYNSAANRAALAPLSADLGRLPEYLTEGEGMLWIGPAGTFTPLHFDLTNNLLAQIVGEKEVILLPPSETRHLAHRRHVFSEVHDLTDPACLARHPDAARTRHYKVTLRAGDLLYVPVGWWHQVRSRSFSAMLTYTNFRWPNDAYASFPAD